MKLPSQMSQDEWFRCIDLHFDSTATLAKSIALLQVMADDVGREEALTGVSAGQGHCFVAGTGFEPVTSGL